jgi:hypothetical protein
MGKREIVFLMVEKEIILLKLRATPLGRRSKGRKKKVMREEKKGKLSSKYLTRWSHMQYICNHCLCAKVTIIFLTMLIWEISLSTMLMWEKKTQF